MKEEKLIGLKLINYLEHNGIAQEINRTFLNPLGLKLELNTNTNEIEFWQTEDEKGYLINRINKMHQQIFMKLSSRKHRKRQKKVGFGIQTKNLYRKENIEKIEELLISPKRLKAEAIITSAGSPKALIFSKFLNKHKEKDNNFDPEQFKRKPLMTGLVENLHKKDWIDVAAFAMLIHQRKELKKEMKEIQIKAESYEMKIKQIKEEEREIKNEI